MRRWMAPVAMGGLLAALGAALGPPATTPGALAQPQQDRFVVFEKFSRKT